MKKLKTTLREKVTLFSLVMTAIMVTGMSSMNLIWHGAWSITTFLSNFPILFVMAFSLQSFVAMPLAKKVAQLCLTADKRDRQKSRSNTTV